MELVFQNLSCALVANTAVLTGGIEPLPSQFALDPAGITIVLTANAAEFFNNLDTYKIILQREV